MISLEPVLIALGFLAAVIGVYNLFSAWRYLRTKNQKPFPSPRNLNELANRDALQAFLDLNFITGSANIRENIVHPFNDHLTLVNESKIYARLLRNEFNAAVRRMDLTKAQETTLLYSSRDSQLFSTEITLGDLIQIADILERLET